GYLERRAAGEERVDRRAERPDVGRGRGSNTATTSPPIAIWASRGRTMSRSRETSAGSTRETTLFAASWTRTRSSSWRTSNWLVTVRSAEASSWDGWLRWPTMRLDWLVSHTAPACSSTAAGGTPGSRKAMTPSPARAVQVTVVVATATGRRLNAFIPDTAPPRPLMQRGRTPGDPTGDG